MLETIVSDLTKRTPWLVYVFIELRGISRNDSKYHIPLSYQITCACADIFRRTPHSQIPILPLQHRVLLSQLLKYTVFLHFKVIRIKRENRKCSSGTSYRLACYSNLFLNCRSFEQTKTPSPHLWLTPLICRTYRGKCIKNASITQWLQRRRRGLRAVSAG